MLPEENFDFRESLRNTVLAVGFPDRGATERRVTEVKFCDGSVQRVKLMEGDQFDERTGVALAVIWQRFGGKKAFYKALNDAMKVLRGQREAEKSAEKFRNYLEMRRKNMEKKRAKRRARAEEKQIRIQTEAYIRAMKICRENGEENAAAWFKEE